MNHDEELLNPSPNLAWYKKQGAKGKLSSRCPFASSKQCPRYFRTSWIFGKHAAIEPMSATESAEREQQLERSPIFSNDFQPQPALYVSDGKREVTGWQDCCPEVAFDAYGVFAVSGSFMDKEDEKLQRVELKKAKVHESDWRWKFLRLMPAHFSDCREYSILMHLANSSKERGKRSGSRNISPKKRWEIFVRDNFTCKYCGRKPPEVALNVDHVVSVHANGTKEPENLVAACEECNAGKSNRPPPKI